MPEISIIPNMGRITNDIFIKKAEMCKPEIYEKNVYPLGIVSLEENSAYPRAFLNDTAEHLSKYPLKKGESICLDFGDHQVGYITLRFSSVGSPQDAPAYIFLKFAEITRELVEDSAKYDGWISRGWIQEEFIHLDDLPAEITLPRRYAFRFLQIKAIDTSAKWRLVVEKAVCKSVSAVREDQAKPYRTDDKLISRIDKVSLRTLQNCMQSVFEDGPKRDRRLWLGDLRLQALVDYTTFKNYNLVKRCLYLFAGQTKDDGQVSACMFLKPEIIADDTFLLDYSLLFGVVLLDYFEASGDIDTLKELSICAYRQIEIARNWFDDTHLLVPGEGFWGFIDWAEGLDKQAAMQGVYIYCVNRVKKIAEILEDRKEIKILEEESRLKSEAARRYLFDSDIGLFVSGPNRQINHAAQVWMILAGVVTAKEGAEILERTDASVMTVKMVSPYMNHYYVEALLVCGEKEKAFQFIKAYWGGMVGHGADTFWELYDPDNPSESPYGLSIVNSYCHAWSCTPAYIFRKYY